MRFKKGVFEGHLFKFLGNSFLYNFFLRPWDQRSCMALLWFLKNPLGSNKQDPQCGMCVDFVLIVGSSNY